MRQQQELLNLSTENNTRDFWKKIGKLGIANDRRSSIPMEVLTSEGNVCKDIKTVYDTWKCKYEHLFNVTDSKYDEDFLCTVQHQLENEIINLSGKESEILNNDISYDDVEKAVYRAKLNKAGGLDQICAEFLLAGVIWLQRKLLLKIIKVVEASYRTDKEKNAVLRRMLTRIILAHFSSEMRSRSGLATDAEIEHEENEPVAITRDKKNVSDFIGYIHSNMTNPFNVADHP
ncbi:unnamed protein product [Mytilus edulis]|uniref:Uncharacterized protein n=1 Tax=Mytilus edulis TaxID=6550 RepID=A0A8S3V9C0_MYTED|nr:unnamed protein product [Mytilus edulis]